MEKIDLLLNEYISNPKGWKQWLKNKNEIIEELNNIFPQVENLNEKIYWIKNNLNSYPRCPICGNEIKKWKGRNKGGYFKFCSCKCAQADKNTRDKIKNTCLKKYGVDNYSKTEKFKKYISDYISSDTIQNKINSTKRKNNTFNTSKPEDKAYEFLTQYTNVIRQYKCKCYPFCCDFYLKDFDIFIECNFHWTHGGHPFDPSSIKDQVKLERWKTKGTKYYDNAINTWIKMDVEKRNKAKEENLNYIEFWSLKELKEFFIDYFENHNIG